MENLVKVNQEAAIVLRTIHLINCHAVR